MHVLDIACGLGNESMLLADAVGKTRSVVAFDREPRAVAVARAWALPAGYRCIEFVVASDESFPAQTGFDAAIQARIMRVGHHARALFDSPPTAETKS